MNWLRRLVGRLGRRRWPLWTAAAVAGVLVAGLVALQFVDEPLRRSIERRMNENLEGYSARIGKAKLHLFGLWIDLHDVTVRQDRHPDPPVLLVPRLTASVQWRALLSGKIVADCHFEQPFAHIDLAQLNEEAKDEVPLDQRGWKDALQAIYPLKINLLQVDGGRLTYQDEGDPRPLEVHHIFILAEDIRTVRSKNDEYPSPFRASAIVFDRGRAELKGNADFLSKPYPGVTGTLDVERIDLGYFQPVARHLGLVIHGGEFAASGRFTYTPDAHGLDLDELVVDQAGVDYVIRPETQEQEARVKQTVSRIAHDVATNPRVEISVRRIVVNGSRIGFINELRSPPFHLFLTDANLEVANLSNRPEQGEAVAALRGRFMGSGKTLATARFFPEGTTPNFKASLEINDTQLKDLNDLLRAYGNFDVVAGTMSFYTEVDVRDGWVNGYIKPLFKDVDVYDHEQDKDKSFFHKVYEKIVGGLAHLLTNRKRQEVATVTSLSGPVGNTHTNTGEVVGGLLRNAFIKSILPGFQHEVKLHHNKPKHKKSRAGAETAQLDEQENNATRKR